MTENEAKEYMENEVKCIKKASHCDRDCLNCELVKEEEPLIESYDMAIQALEKQSMVNEILHELREYSAIGTIEEFKALKEKEERFDRNIKMFNEIGLEIRNKAIDEFAEKLIKHFADWQLSEDNVQIKYIITQACEGIEEITEQMKAGGENE